MRIDWKTRRQLRLASTGFIVLLLGLVALLVFVTRTYHLAFDWTHNNVHTLSEASTRLLAKLDKPVRITLFASDNPELRSLTQAAQKLVARYQQAKPDVSFEIVNPDLVPVRVREAGITSDGEALIEYAGRRETTRLLNEPSLTGALSRLSRGSDRWILFVSGHGERSPDREANHDLSLFAQRLQQTGFRTRAFTLGESKSIPANTAVLVIAGPRVRYLPGEVKQIEKYLAGGGNLIWFAEPGGQQGLEPIAESLGVEFLKGAVVDPVSQAMTRASADFLILSTYGRHPSVAGFHLRTLFPQATGLRHRETKEWQVTPLIETTESAWQETGLAGGEVQFDRGRDVAGPVTLALAFTRKLEEREQRLVVLGDGDFLSNTYLGNLGNQDLGMNLMNWAATDDVFLNIPTRTAPDLTLDLSRTAQVIIALGFLVVLPLALLGTGFTLWWRRRKR